MAVTQRLRFSDLYELGEPLLADLFDDVLELILCAVPELEADLLLKDGDLLGLGVGTLIGFPEAFNFVSFAILTFCLAFAGVCDLERLGDLLGDFPALLPGDFALGDVVLGDFALDDFSLSLTFACFLPLVSSFLLSRTPKEDHLFLSVSEAWACFSCVSSSLQASSNF